MYRLRFPPEPLAVPWYVWRTSLVSVSDRADYQVVGDRGRRSQSSSGDADGPVGVTGHRHGHRSRSLMGTFGRTKIAVPRARFDGPDGQTTE